MLVGLRVLMENRVYRTREGPPSLLKIECLGMAGLLQEKERKRIQTLSYLMIRMRKDKMDGTTVLEVPEPTFSLRKSTIKNNN